MMSLDVHVLQRSGIVMRSQKDQMVPRSDHFMYDFFLKGIWEGGGGLVCKPKWMGSPCLVAQPNDKIKVTRNMVFLATWLS
jgi:hypothetical protein